MTTPTSRRPDKDFFTVGGQVFSREILAFICDLDTAEIHGYEPD